MNQPVRPTLSQMKAEDIKQFWRVYGAWLSTASDDDLFQLEKSLESLQPHEVMQLAKAIGLAIRDEQSRRALPVSLVRHLRAASWPAAQVAA